jgi:ABC-2 type transport system ATP-binding protein
VDPQSRENLLLAVREIAERGTTIVFTTHYIEEAERVCDRLAIVDGGRVIACGTSDELLATVGLGEVVALRGVVLDEADPRSRRGSSISHISPRWRGRWTASRI